MADLDQPLQLLAGERCWDEFQVDGIGDDLLHQSGHALPDENADA
jgi:hypothetical protein